MTDQPEKKPAPAEKTGFSDEAIQCMKDLLDIQPFEGTGAPTPTPPAPPKTRGL